MKAGSETGLVEWQRRQRRFTERMQCVSYRYGQLALLPTPLRLEVSKGIGRSEALQAATLFVAARRGPTAPEPAASVRRCAGSDPDLPLSL